MDLNAVRLFVATVQAGSLSKASDECTGQAAQDTFI